MKDMLTPRHPDMIHALEEGVFGLVCVRGNDFNVVAFAVIYTTFDDEAPFCFTVRYFGGQLPFFTVPNTFILDAVESFIMSMIQLNPNLQDEIKERPNYEYRLAWELTTNTTPLAFHELVRAGGYKRPTLEDTYNYQVGEFGVVYVKLMQHVDITPSQSPSDYHAQAESSDSSEPFVCSTALWDARKVQRTV